MLSDGMSSVYPAGMEIGHVVSVDKNEYNRIHNATVQPSVDLSSLDYVVVIKGYDKELPEGEDEEKN